MRQVWRLVVCALCAMWATAGAAAAQGDCDRACLRTTLDRYLSAVVVHDPARAPLAVGFRQTENAVNTRPGDGVWKTVTGLGAVQRRYFDALTGQAGYFGIVEEGSRLAVVTVRVRVERRQITEAEWYLARNGDPGLRPPREGQPPPNLFNPEGLAKDPPPQRTLPPAARASREAMIAITNSYFDGITSHDGSVIVAHKGCNRTENGTLVTVPGPAATVPGTAASGPQRIVDRDCTYGLSNFDLSMVVARRIPLVDEEAGVALGLAIFVRRPGSTAPRNVFSEWFVIDDNKIRRIYSAMFYPGPELAAPNWPPYEGHWPLPAGTVPAAR